MESVTIKVEETMGRRIDALMKRRGYATKTEFIREAIRDKIEADERGQLVQDFLKYRGAAKKKTMYADNKKVREEVARQIAKEYGVGV